MLPWCSEVLFDFVPSSVDLSVSDLHRTFIEATLYKGTNEVSVRGT